MDAICFKSPLFQIEKGEDEETNPYRYGKQLAHWLKGKLEVTDYKDLQVVPEDWGWCIVFEKDNVSFLVGCGNMEDMEFLNNPELFNTKEIVWSCFAEARVPFLKRVFKRVDPEAYEKELSSRLAAILQSENEINIVECP